MPEHAWTVSAPDPRRALPPDNPGSGAEALAWGEEQAARPRQRTLAQTAAGLRNGLLWAAFDALAGVAVVLAAHALSPVFTANPLGPGARLAAVVFALAFVLAGLAAGLYEPVVWRSRRSLVLRAGIAGMLAGAGMLAYHYLVLFAPVGRRVALAAVALSLPAALAPRLVLWEFLRRRPRRLLFVGQDPLQQRTRELLQADPQHSYELVAQAPGPDAGALVEYCRAAEIDEVVLPSRADEMQAALAPALACLPLGCRVRPVADFYEEVFRSVPVRQVSAQWLLAKGWDSSNHLAEGLKRATDVLLALLLLLLSAPLLALLALVQRFHDAGPVFYSQTRVGRYGRPFRILKLRTMRVDAESTGPRWSEPDDPRRTRLGVLLRRTRLDELPQLVNVLRGEMSFVGPRPERPEFVAEIERQVPFYGWRHLVRPGLTGWAQIHYPYGASVADAEKKLEYDLYYLRHLSWLSDLMIVARTASRALKGGR